MITKQNKLRIIGGTWRSRQIKFDDVPGLRPTPSRVRETMFNWLQSEVIGSRCLDLFSGSGALGFEAASRGAKCVLQVENNVQAVRNLKENAMALSADQVKLVQMDVMEFLAGNPETFDLVFLDPPFGRNLVEPACRWLEQKGWLMPHAKIYVETEAHIKLSGMPENWRLLKSKRAGEVNYELYQRQGNENFCESAE